MQRTLRIVLAVLLVSLVTPVIAAAQDTTVTVTQQAVPLLIVDGVVVGGPSSSSTRDWRLGSATQAIVRIPPTDIESVDVIKGAAAVELYGTRAAGGVIIIRTKGNAAANAKPMTDEQRLWTELFKQLRTVETPPETPKRQPLFVVDGIIIGRGVDMAGLDTTLKDRIDSISVLKGAAATAAYGPAGADGVIVIITK